MTVIGTGYNSEVFKKDRHKIKQERRKNPYDFCGEDYTEERCKKVF